MIRFLRLLLIVCIAAPLFGSLPAHAAGSTQSSIVVILAAGTLDVTATGSVAFPSATLTGDDQNLSATTAPSFTFTDSTGTGAGWNVTFISSNFSNGSGGTIAPVNFRFSSGGTLIKLSGDPIHPTKGPKETGLVNATLDISRKIVTVDAGKGKGSYQYDPLTSDFALTVPAETLTGSYTATITATINSGP